MSLADRDHPVSCAAMATSVDRCTNTVISATFRHFLPNSKTEKKASGVDACGKRPLGVTQTISQRKIKHRVTKQADKSQVAFVLYSLYTRV